MGIGASILLIAVGLILAVATNFTISGFDIEAVGWILVAAGVLGLIMTAVIWGPRRQRGARGGDYRVERTYRDDRTYDDDTRY